MMDKLGVRNLFSCDTDTFRDAVHNRNTKVKEEKELYEIIIGSINYFNERMKTKMELLQQRSLDPEQRINRGTMSREGSKMFT